MNAHTLRTAIADARRDAALIERYRLACAYIVAVDVARTAKAVGLALSSMDVQVQHVGSEYVRATMRLRQLGGAR